MYKLKQELQDLHEFITVCYLISCLPPFLFVQIQSNAITKQESVGIHESHLFFIIFVAHHHLSFIHPLPRPSLSISILLIIRLSLAMPPPTPCHCPATIGNILRLNPIAR
ncbi:hypothetical protein EYC80_001242 [Monilinia laxa]|uniref:Uncharacterized protein n=1 Tax=Monilinia laxa TaxID=61186 RepID=A0A5N6K8U3_MONLA|nr:hypothetical protein EYC80_001242 [Monilinia laxa]